MSDKQSGGGSSRDSTRTVGVARPGSRVGRPAASRAGRPAASRAGRPPGARVGRPREFGSAAPRGRRGSAAHRDLGRSSTGIAGRPSWDSGRPSPEAEWTAVRQIRVDAGVGISGQSSVHSWPAFESSRRRSGPAAGDELAESDRSVGSRFRVSGHGRPVRSSDSRSTSGVVGSRSSRVGFASSRPPTSGSRPSRPDPTASWTGHARRPGSADPRGRPGRRLGPGHAELAAHAARRPGRDRGAAPRGGRARAAR